MRKKSIGLSNDNTKLNTFTAYQRGNNRDGSPHYVFLYSDDDDDNDDDDDDDDKNNCNESIALQSRHNKLQKNIYPRKVEVITVTLKPDDTLQALSLRYRCSISELKRINKIHNDNEIFARRIVKVPVQPFSILTELNSNDNDYHDENKYDNGSMNKNNEIINDNNTIIDRVNNDIITFPSCSNSNNSDININNIILNSLSIDKLRNNSINDNIHVNYDENHELLLINDHDSDLTQESRAIELFGCSGADWGLTWIHLLVASLLFGFVLPLFYIIFITEKQHDHHNVTDNQ